MDASENTRSACSALLWMTEGIQFQADLERIDKTGDTHPPRRVGAKKVWKHETAGDALLLLHRTALLPPFHHAHGTVCPRVCAMSASLRPGFRLKYSTFTIVECGKLSAYTPRPHCATRDSRKKTHRPQKLNLVFAFYSFAHSSPDIVGAGSFFRRSASGTQQPHARVGRATTRA